MPRIAGQIDLAKNEAILDVAAETFAERGVSVGLGEIARRAGVSKQTIYNHYGSKADLVRAIVDRRAREITAPLETPGAAENLQETLIELGRQMLSGLLAQKTQGMTKLSIIMAVDMPEIGRAFYEAGPHASRLRLAQFLKLEHEAGRLEIPDPEQAASYFLGMMLGPYQLSGLLGLQKDLTRDQVETAAHEAVARFMRAYAPAS